jgi:hypothetical protein
MGKTFGIIALHGVVGVIGNKIPWAQVPTYYAQLLVLRATCQDHMLGSIMDDTMDIFSS